MSTTTQLRAYITIDTTVMAKGSPELENLKAALKGVTASTEGAAMSTLRLHEASEQASVSTRSLLLNFRMFSFAVRTLRRELGITNPLFEQFSRVMLIGAAAGTLFVSANTLITKGIPALTGEFGKGVSAVRGFQLALEGGSVAVVAISVALAGLVGFAFGTWIGEQLSPIKEINAELKAYKEQIEDVTTALSELKVEQSAISAESAMYAAAMARINYEIKLQGYTTDAQAESLKLLGNAATQASLAQTDLRATTAMATAEIQRATTESAQLEAEKKEAKQAASRALSVYGPGREAPEGLARFNPFEAANRDMLARQVTGLPVEVIVDFAGAVFGNAGDITGAVRRGIDEGFQNVGRILEQLRRGQ